MSTFLETLLTLHKGNVDVVSPDLIRGKYLLKVYCSLGPHIFVLLVKICLHATFFSPCPLSLPILNKRDKIDPPPIVSIIHTVTTGTMLNRNGSNFRTINDRVTVVKVMREFIPKIIHQTHTGSWSLVNQRALSLRLDII